MMSTDAPKTGRKALQVVHHIAEQARRPGDKNW